MHWDALSAVAEAIGALAVALTLISLVVQLRQLAEQTRQYSLAIKFSSYGARAGQLLGWLHETALDGDLSRILHTANHATRYRDEKLDEVGWYRFGLAMRAVFIIWEDLFLQHQAGTVGPILLCASPRVAQAAGESERRHARLGGGAHVRRLRARVHRSHRRDRGVDSGGAPLPRFDRAADPNGR